MSVFRAYKTELDPNKGQWSALYSHAGAARWAYNTGLAVEQRYYDETGHGLGHFRLNKLLTTWKQHPANSWTYEVSNYCFQSALKDLTCALQNFFAGRARYPRFKSRATGANRFRLYGKIKVEGRKVRLPVLGSVATKERNYLPSDSKIVSATVSERAGRWFVSLQVEELSPNTATASGEAIGVDLGLKVLAAVSDGRVYDAPKALVKHQNNMARLQRKLARRVKGSKRRQAAKVAVARLHLRITNIRANAIHEMTSDLVGVGLSAGQRPAAIVIEDLAVSNMMKNHHLAQSIADASWAEVRRQLTYKCEWWGVELIVAPRFFASSKTCSVCGEVKAELSLRERTYKCAACGAVIDRDLNAARTLMGLAGKAPDNENGRGGECAGLAVTCAAKPAPAKRLSEMLSVAPAERQDSSHVGGEPICASASA